MIKIVCSEEEDSIESKGSTKELLIDLTTRICNLKADEHLVRFGHLAEYFEDKYAKDNTSN